MDDTAPPDTAPPDAGLPDRTAILADAYRRGLLTGDLKDHYEEAMRRKLVPPAAPPSAPPGAGFGDKFIATPLATAVSSVIGAPRTLKDLYERGTLWAVDKLIPAKDGQPLDIDQEMAALHPKEFQPSVPDPTDIHAEDVHRLIQKGADLMGVDTNARATSPEGRLAQSALTGAATAGMMPIGGLVPSVLSGASGGAASEAAGQATKGTPWELLARILGQLAGGGLPILGRSLVAPGVPPALKESVLNLTKDQAAQVDARLRDAQVAAAPATATETIQTVTGQNPKLAAIQADAEANAPQGSRLQQIIANRAAANQAAFARTIGGVTGPVANPETIGPRVQAAAADALNATPQGAALDQAQRAAGPPASAAQAGAAIRPELAAGAEARAGMRTALAAGDAAAARDAAESVNTSPVLNLIDQKLATVKGATRDAVGKARALLMVGRAPETSVGGLTEADNEIGDMIAAAQKAGNTNTAAHLGDIQDALRRQLDTAPVAGQARPNLAAASAPLQPYQTGVVGQALAPGQYNGYALPVEQIAPKILEGGPSEVDNFLAATASRPDARQAFENYVTTTARAAPDGLRGWMSQNADVLDRLPATRLRLENLAVAQEGRAALDRTPTGKLAATPELEDHAAALLDPQATTLTPAQVRQTVTQVALRDPQAAKDLVRRAIEVRWNEANRTAIAGGDPAGGAAFRTQIAGTPEQAANLEALFRSLPNGDAAWTGFNRLLGVFEAQGQRVPPSGAAATALRNPRLDAVTSGAHAAGVTAARMLAGGASGAAAAPAALAVGGGTAAARALQTWLEKSALGYGSNQIGHAISSPDGLAALRQLALAAPTSDLAAGLALRALGEADPQQKR